jgi:hypothetical protein
VDAALSGRAGTLDDLARLGLENDVDRAHAGDFVRFVSRAADASGKPALPALLELARLEPSKGPTPFDEALVLATGAPDRATLDARWRADRARRYAFVPALLGLLFVVGLLAGAWSWLRRSRAARVGPRVREGRRERAAAAVKPARTPAKVTAAARLAAGRGKDAAIHIPRDPEVPKVEHNGEWHTLH